MSVSTTHSVTGEAGAVVDLEALLAPIAGDNPAGENLRYAGLHDEIREARRADDQLAQGEWRRENKLADWPRVIELASEALATQTKDMRIGSWLAEALVEQHGLAGFRDGLKVMSGLQLNFWDELYPESDEGDLDARANSLAWLDQQLSVALKRVPLTDGSGGLRYSYSDWEDSQKFDIPANTRELDSAEQEALNDLRTRAAEEGKITSEQWRAARNTTGRQFYEATYLVLSDCFTEFQALNAAIDEKFERQAPGLRSIQGALEDVHALVERILQEKRVLEPDAPASAQTSDSDGNQTGFPVEGNGAGGGSPAMQLRGATAGRASSSAIASRQEAYRKLAEAAAYFREAEPHSPVSYLVERAIRWGQMPLESWLAEVVKSDDVLIALRETLGLKQGSHEEQSDQSEDEPE
jgi:type VI secretion system protein ImpA